MRDTQRHGLERVEISRFRVSMSFVKSLDGVQILLTSSSDSTTLSIVSNGAGSEAHSQVKREHDNWLTSGTSRLAADKQSNSRTSITRERSLLGLPTSRVHARSVARFTKLNGRLSAPTTSPITSAMFAAKVLPAIVASVRAVARITGSRRRQ